MIFVSLVLKVLLMRLFYHLIDLSALSTVTEDRSELNFNLEIQHGMPGECLSGLFTQIKVCA